MEMKNKLIKHHKNSMHFYFHDLAIILGLAVGLIAIISIPTYISLIVTIRSQAQASEKEVVETTNEEEELLTVSDIAE